MKPPFETADQLLDDMLLWFARSDNANPSVTVEEVTVSYLERYPQPGMEKFAGNVSVDIGRIVRKLDRDGFVERVGNAEDGKQMFTITFEGMVFLNDGGYIAKSRSR